MSALSAPRIMRFTSHATYGLSKKLLANPPLLVSKVAGLVVVAPFSQVDGRPFSIQSALGPASLPISLMFDALVRSCM